MNRNTMFSWSRSTKYTQVAGSETEKENEPCRTQSRKVHAIWYPLYILTALSVGFVAGKYMAWSPANDSIGMAINPILRNSHLLNRDSTL
jgi:hypothetical protein